MPIQKRKAWLTGLGLLAASTWGQAQCITLEQLMDLSALGAEPPAQRGARHLPAAEWTYRGAGQFDKEVYWTYKDPLDDYAAPDGSAEAWLSVRPVAGTHIATMKTTFPACINSIRTELRLRKLTQTPITCRDCEAVRFEGPRLIVDVYDRKKGAYPFIVTVRHLPSAAASKEVTTLAAPAAAAPSVSKP